MEYDLDLAIGLLALLVAAYGMVALRFARWSISAAFSFLVIGAIIGGAGIGVTIDDLPAPDVLSALAEITLALVLFAAASTIRLKRLEMDSSVALRLLAIGLPLTIALGTILALGLFPGISIGLALLIGATLAPTDADLGHQVISDTSVPARMRRLLNVEAWTVVLSVVLHGFSATPLAHWYGRYAESLPDGAPELLGEHGPRRAAWGLHDHKRPHI